MIFIKLELYAVKVGLKHGCIWYVVICPIKIVF